MFDFIYSLFCKDIGIDLGTANTLIHVRGEGIALSEPSVVAVQNDTNAVLAVGSEAKRMLGRTPADIVAIRPMKDGVIANFEITEEMIKYFIARVHDNRKIFVRPRVVIGIPSGITEVERKAVRDAALQAGAREVYLIEEPLAAAIGADIQIHEPSGNMVIDIGGGTSEVAVISLGGMVVSNSIRTGGNEMDEAIINHVKKTHSLIIGERTAEDTKIKIGSAFPDEEELTCEIKGRDAATGLPRTVVVTSSEVREALSEAVLAIVGVVTQTLEETPPELASDIVDKGIIMAGGGALLRGLDKLISQETGLPTFLAENPLQCVVMGTGRCLEELEYLRRARKK